MKRQLSVPEKHQLRIARDTMKMSDAGARILGGPNKEEARAIIIKLTGVDPLKPRYRKVHCDQCDIVAINGLACHEFGCPNRKHRMS